jgi:AAA family ATP:ADP antiporter
MRGRISRWLDLRQGEVAPLAFSFSYVALVVAAFLLAKPIRNGLFLHHYGPYALVYVYAAVPLALTVLVPVIHRLGGRVGQRTIIIASLWFFCSNVVVFWLLFRLTDIWILPAVLYVWVNCFGVIAPVQAWTFVSSLFDTRQAKRLFGLIGAGASFGGITGGLLGRVLVRPVGGTINLLLVLAALIGLAACLVSASARRAARAGRTGRAGIELPAAAHVRERFGSALRTIAQSRYLRLIATLVFLVAIATQWIGFQLSLVADARFAGNADRLTAFYSSFNLYLGVIAFLLQVFATGPFLRKYGMTFAILLLPFSLFAGTALIFVLPLLGPVLFTAAFDQGLRFSVDKASYELLYLPLTQRQRSQLKGVIDIVVNRSADAAGAVLLGVATRGFFGLGGYGLGLRGTAAINLGLLALWSAVAWRLRSEYVVTIGESIREHRLEAERAAAAAVERSAADALDDMLASDEEDQIAYALAVLQEQPEARPHPSLTRLLRHGSADIRCRALRLLNETGEPCALEDVQRLVGDQDLATRTEALLYLSRHTGCDPIAAAGEIRDFPEHCVRASIAAYLATPGPAQNTDAARLILRAMIDDDGPTALEVRREAARLAELRPEIFQAEIAALLALPDQDAELVKHAVRAAGRLRAAELAPLLIQRLANPEHAEEVAQALGNIGERALPHLRLALTDDRLPVETRRALPGILARVGTPSAQALLVDAMLQSDAGLRHRIIASLNKVHRSQPHLFADPEAVELVLAAEITGHYRSYQVLGALSKGAAHDEIEDGMRHAMDQELERIFRLIGLAMPGVDLHSAYVALSAPDRAVRANALEFLETTLKPDLARLLLPLIDPQVTLDQRVQLANRLVGASIDSVDGAIETLLASEDSWLRQTAYAARARLWQEPEPEPAPAPTPAQEQPAALGAGL